MLIMEALDGLDDTHEYCAVGHSGTGPEAELLLPWGSFALLFIVLPAA